MDILSDVNVNGKIISNDVIVHNSICASNFSGDCAEFGSMNIVSHIQSGRAIIKDSVSTCRLQISEFSIAGKMEVPTYGDPTKNYYLRYVSYCLLVPQGCNKFQLTNNYSYYPLAESGTMFFNILDADSRKFVYMDLQEVPSYGEWYDIVATRSDLDEKKYLIKYLQLTDN